MKESYAFRAIQGEFLEKKKKERKNIASGDVKEQFDTEDRPMRPGEHLASLKVILEKTLSPEEKAEQQENAKSLKELLSPALFGEYQTIFSEAKSLATVNKKHPIREAVDFEKGPLGVRAQAWIGSVVQAV